MPNDVNIVGVYTSLRDGEVLEVENPIVSMISFEKGIFFKSYDTCIGKIFLTNQRILILKLIMFEGVNLNIKSIDQFGSVLGQWFDIPLEYITSVSTPRQSLLRSLLSGVFGEKKEGLEVHYESPMPVEKKSLFWGTKKVKETFIIVFTIENKDLWSLKTQTCVTNAKNRTVAGNQ